MEDCTNGTGGGTRHREHFDHFMYNPVTSTKLMYFRSASHYIIMLYVLVLHFYFFFRKIGLIDLELCVNGSGPEILISLYI